MSDETLHPDPDTAGELLASQYVDDQSSPEERAQAESSPEIMALVQQFSAQRSALADVPPPSDAARDAAVATALAQFTMVAPPSNVVSIDRRRRTRWLTAAAAVMLLGVGGVVVAQLSTRSDDAGGSEFSATAKNDSDSRVATGATDGTDALVTGDTIAGSAAGGGAPEVQPTDSAASTQTIGAINDPVSAVPEVHTNDALRSAGAGTSAVQPNIELACTIEEPKEIVAEITWKGTPAVVVRDTVTGVITALDSQCTALATVAP